MLQTFDAEGRTFVSTGVGMKHPLEYSARPSNLSRLMEVGVVFKSLPLALLASTVGTCKAALFRYF